MRDDQTYRTTPYMSRSPKGQIVDEIKGIELQDGEYVEFPYPINLNEFDLDGPYLPYRILFYELQCMNSELNELGKRLENIVQNNIERETK